MSVRIPLWLHGKVRAYAVIDDRDAALARQRWTLRAIGRARYAERSNGRAGEVARFMHQAVLDPDGTSRLVVDHINGNGLDNRRSKAQLDGRKVFLGRFAMEAEAHEAVAAFRAEHMPFDNGGHAMTRESLLSATRTSPDGTIEAEPVLVERDGQVIRLVRDDGDTLELDARELAAAMEAAA